MSIWKIGISEDEMEDSNGSYDGNSDADTGDNAEALPYDEQRALTAAAGFLCSDNVSPKVFRDGGPFRQFMGLLNPLFKPSCAEIESKCMEIYVEKSSKVKNILENLDGQISLSLDILSAGDADGVFCDYYLCFSAHFIDENWKPMKLVLYYRSLSLPDSVDDIPHEDEDWGIFRSAADWGIASKISTLTMTNDSYYNEVVESVKTHIQEKKVLELNGQLFRVYCCGEIIAEMVQGAFEMIENTIDKIRELISFNFMFPLWHLTNSKLKDALDTWSEGEFSSQDVIDHYDVPSPEEWSKVEGVWKVVDSIYEVSHALFETKPLTANVYLYHLHQIRKILVQMSTDSDSFIRTIVEGMLEKFSKYWDDMFLMLAITAALDPRFKMKYVEFVFSEVQGTEGKSQGASVFESIHELFDNYVLHFPEKESFIGDSSSPDSNSEESPPPAKNANHTFSVLQDYQKFIQMNDQPAKKSELDCYLEEPVLSWTEDFDALIWWRTAGAKYPTLSRMARDFLAIPISLGTSHKAFYSEPRPADRFLVGVKPDLMNALKCTRSWSPLY